MVAWKTCNVSEFAGCQEGILLGYRQNVWGKSRRRKLSIVALCLELQHCWKALYHFILKDFLFFNIILNISSDIYSVALTNIHDWVPSYNMGKSAAKSRGNVGGIFLCCSPSEQPVYFRLNWSFSCYWNYWHYLLYGPFLMMLFYCFVHFKGETNIFEHACGVCVGCWKCCSGNCGIKCDKNARVENLKLEIVALKIRWWKLWYSKTS